MAVRRLYMSVRRLYMVVKRLYMAVWLSVFSELLLLLSFVTNNTIFFL